MLILEPNGRLDRQLRTRRSLLGTLRAKLARLLRWQ